MKFAGCSSTASSWSSSPSSSSSSSSAAVFALRSPALSLQSSESILQSSVPSLRIGERLQRSWVALRVGRINFTLCAGAATNRCSLLLCSPFPPPTATPPSHRVPWARFYESRCRLCDCWACVFISGANLLLSKTISYIKKAKNSMVIIKKEGKQIIKSLN